MPLFDNGRTLAPLFHRRLVRVALFHHGRILTSLLNRGRVWMPVLDRWTINIRPLLWWRRGEGLLQHRGWLGTSPMMMMMRRLLEISRSLLLYMLRLTRSMNLLLCLLYLLLL